MTNPVWVWAIEQGYGGWKMDGIFHGPCSKQAGPSWSPSRYRYGETETILPDGRMVSIGGAHEDWYDPDFYIYNDIIVTDSSGRIEIFGYPEDIFPPTDFHTATPAGDRLFLIGNTPYSKRDKTAPQVMALDTRSYRIEPIETIGESPAWLWGHSAELVDDDTALLVRGGEVSDYRFPVSIDNIDDWRFDLSTFRWDRLTRRKWTRFIFMRADRSQHRLFWLRSLQRDLAESRGMGKFRDRASFLRIRDEILDDLWPEPRLDLLDRLFLPDQPHSVMPELPDEYRVYRYSIEGVTVRYVENSHDLQLVMEGELPSRIVEQLRSDLQSKFSLIENTTIDCISVETW